VADDQHYDVVIIGTGAGGGTLGHRLATNGVKVLWLERGPFLPRERDNWQTEAVFVRAKYLKGEGVYGCVSVDHDATGDARAIVLAISKAVGSTRAGVVEMTFQHETEGDNFEEQILYGGAIHLMRACFEVMVKNGYPPSFAYAKAIRSLRSVIDVMDEKGIEEYLTKGCSRTCEFAVRSRGPRVINRAEIEKIFDETEKGIFARDWLQEWALGMPQLHRLRRTAAESEMEKTGATWRKEFGR